MYNSLKGRRCIYIGFNLLNAIEGWASDKALYKGQGSYMLKADIETQYITHITEWTDLGKDVPCDGHIFNLGQFFFSIPSSPRIRLVG